MRFRKKDEKNFIKVGIFITLLTLVLMVMIVSIGKENSLFHPKVELRALVEDVKNLKPGSYVELKGIRVGSVDKINIISEEEVEIRFTILKSELKWIKQDSKIVISTAGLVGDKFLEIYNGTKSSPLFDPKKDTLISENLSDIKQIISKGDSIATITERILTRVDLFLANIEDGKKVNQSINTLNKAISNIEKITQELKEAQIGQSIKNANLSLVKLEKASGSIQKVMSRIENGPGTLNSLIYDEGLHDNLRALLGGASRNKVITYFIRESIKNSERKKPKAD